MEISLSHNRYVKTPVKLPYWVMKKMQVMAVMMMDMMMMMGEMMKVRNKNETG